MAFHSFYYLIWLPFLLFTNGLLVNRTIDDAQSSDGFGAVLTYSAGWNTVSASSPCPKCHEKPDASQFFLQTWHDGSAAFSNKALQLTLEFTGVGVYIFVALNKNGLQATAMETALQFSIDGASTGGYTFPPETLTGPQVWLYNQMVFSKTGLSNSPHSLVIRVLAPSASFYSFMMFDYATYTQELPDPPTPQSNNNPPPDPPSAPKTSPSAIASSAPPTVPASSSSSASQSTFTPLRDSASSQANPAPSQPISNPQSTSSNDDSPDASSPSSSASSSSTVTISHSPPNILAIIGGAIATILLLVIITLVFYIHRRRKRERNRFLEPPVLTKDFERPPTMTPFDFDSARYAVVEDNAESVSSCSKSMSRSGSGSNGWMTAAQEKRALMVHNNSDIPKESSATAGPSGSYHLAVPAVPSESSTYSHSSSYSHSTSDAHAFYQAKDDDVAPPEYAR